MFVYLNLPTSIVYENTYINLAFDKLFNYFEKSTYSINWFQPIKIEILKITFQGCMIFFKYWNSDTQFKTKLKN